MIIMYICKVQLQCINIDITKHRNPQKFVKLVLTHKKFILIPCCENNLSDPRVIKTKVSFLSTHNLGRVYKLNLDRLKSYESLSPFLYKLKTSFSLIRFQCFIQRRMFDGTVPFYAFI